MVKVGFGLRPTPETKRGNRRFWAVWRDSIGSEKGYSIPHTNDDSFHSFGADGEYIGYNRPRTETC